MLTCAGWMSSNAPAASMTMDGAQLAAQRCIERATPLQIPDNEIDLCHTCHGQVHGGDFDSKRAATERNDGNLECF